MLHLSFDPAIRVRETFFERNPWRPTEDFAESCIVRVSAPYALRAWNMLLYDRDAGDFRSELGQRINGDESICSQVQWFAMGGLHNPKEADEAVIDITE
jgi:hypothetical protein